MREGGAVARPALAVLALAAILAVTGTWLVWSFSRVALIEEASEAGRDLLRRLEGQHARSAPMGEERPAADLVSLSLPGATPAIAGAGLQSTVAAVIAGEGAQLIETQFVTSQAEAVETATLALKVSFSGGTNQLQRVLFALESRPLLVRQLAVSRDDAASVEADTDPRLNVVMLVEGYWRQ
jgi:hypothetical protein